MNATACGLTVACLVALGGSRVAAAEANANALTVTSTAFENGAAISTRFTCEGDGVSPPLAWSGPPGSTKSLAIVVDDADAPGSGSGKKPSFVHWIVYGLAPSTRSLPEHANKAPAGAHDGQNDFGQLGYGGPCPPKGQHHYVFKVYALDVALSDLGKPHAPDLYRAMEGHVVAHGQLVGTYEKGRGPRT